MPASALEPTHPPVDRALPSRVQRAARTPDHPRPPLPGDLRAEPERRLAGPLDPGLLVGSTDAEILQGFVDMVRTWRGDKPRKALQLRAADVAVLVAILGTEGAEVERRLVAATACSPKLAKHSRRLLLGSLGVLVVGLVGAPHIGGASIDAELAGSGGRGQDLVTTMVPSTTAPEGAAAASSVSLATPATPVAQAPVEAAPEVVAPPATARSTVPAGAEAVVTIDSVGIDLPVVLGGQSVIDQGVVAHYTAPGWEPPVPAGSPGTYWLAAHATTHGSPFNALPDVAIGAEIRVDTGGQTFVYTVTSSQVTGLWPGDDLMYGTDPTAPVILLQTCVPGDRRLLVHGILTATL